jgi:hypothetical protein
MLHRFNRDNAFAFGFDAERFELLQVKHLLSNRDNQYLDGVVTLSQIERNWPITTNAEAWDSNDFACCSVAEIRLIALNVTTPFDCHFF